MNAHPRVTVLLPVYNGAATIDQAVQSILIQTFSDFELLIVDDGSTDATPAKLASYRDPRVRVERLENRGVGGALKFGVEAARGDLIARMDADDISAPNRLERQVAALEANPDVGVVHALVHYMDRDGKPLAGHQPDSGQQPTLHRWRLLWKNCVMHSTVMMRRSLLVEHGLNYRDGCICEDYDLWSRLLFHTDFLRINEYLLWYRMHPGSASSRFGENHVASMNQIRNESLGRILGGPVDDALARDLAMLSGQTFLRPDDYEPRSSATALGDLMGRALAAFVAHFKVPADRVPRLRRDAARQLLDWAWLVDRCPTPPPDGRWVLVRSALTLDPFTLISRKFLRHLFGVTLGPAWLKRLREARTAWESGPRDDGGNPR
jgi:GT2 family glycosyltransferase